MLVHVVDPSAYTPPYDHALCHALAQAGADVELLTSRFPYGPVAHADDYTRTEHFYRASVGAAGSRLRMACKLAQHVPDMLRYRRLARAADVVHFQWLTVQHLDGHLLPASRLVAGSASSRSRAAGRSPRVRRPLVLTAHDVLPREPHPGQLAAQRRLYERFDAIVVHSRHGRARLTGELGVDPQRVRVIPHGAFAHLAERPPAATPAAAPFQTTEPVVLCFGLMRPYKGIDVLLEAWRGTVSEQSPIEDAELWIAGLPKMDISALRARAPAGVRWDPHFVTDEELPAYFERADLVVLPYLQADQSGVLFTALAFGKPLLLSDVGGFPELTDTGAVRVVPAGDAQALGGALRELLADGQALEQMGRRARRVAEGRYSWDSIARAHIELYDSLLHGG